SGPAAAGPAGPLRRRPGGAPRCPPPTGRLPASAADAPLPLAATAGLAATGPAATAPPGGQPAGQPRGAAGRGPTRPVRAGAGSPAGGHGDQSQQPPAPPGAEATGAARA